MPPYPIELLYAKKPNWKSSFQLLACLVIAAWIFASLDPLHIGIWNENAITRQSLRIQEWLFPYDAKSQNEIAVVLIDKDALKVSQINWPPRSSFYQLLLNYLLDCRPKAIYFSMALGQAVYSDEARAENQELASMAKDINTCGALDCKPGENSPIPVIFAASQHLPLDGKLPVSQLAFTDWSPDAFRLGIYPLNVEDKQRGVESLRQLAKTPALVLYQRICETEPRRQYDKSYFEATPAPLQIRWATSTPREQGKYWPESRDCLKGSGNIISYLLKRDFGSTSSRKICMPFLTINLDALYPSSELDAGASLKDKIVMIGVNIGDHAQFQESPFYLREKSPYSSALPPVYLHALALENLLTAGRSYQKANTREDNDGMVLLFSVLFVAAPHGLGMIYSFSCWTIPRLNLWQNGMRKSALRRILFHLVIATFLMALLILVVGRFHPVLTAEIVVNAFLAYGAAGAAYGILRKLARRKA